MLLEQPDPDVAYKLYSAACYYYMGLFKEAIATTEAVQDHSKVSALFSVLFDKDETQTEVVLRCLKAL